jgi:hypothetical protein
MATNAMLARILGLPESTSEEVLTSALAELAQRSGPAPTSTPELADTPAGRFHQLAELRARAEGCSLTDAYSAQAISTPELWADVRNEQPRY